MSPREITPRSAAFSQPLSFPAQRRKSSLRSTFSKEKLVRGTSPLTPWEDNLCKKQKPSLKGSSRQTKASKSSPKDNKKKTKKDESKSRCDETKSKWASNFMHHADINKYMAEYKNARKSKLKEENSTYEEYGPIEIAKVYESLGVPRLSRLSRLSNASRRNLPLFKDVEIEHEILEDGNDKSPTDSESDDVSDDDIEIPSPVARERRSNLNLSPLRKQVRLPDMNNFPVQTVSGINLLELARIATSRAESSEPKNNLGTATSYSRARFTSPEKKLLATALNLQEKVMCRVVDLSLPNSYELQFQKYCKNPKEITDKAPEDVADTSSENIEANKDVLLFGSRKVFCTTEKIKKIDLSEPLDDALTIAISTSRSCQSSVLSHAVSPNSSASPNQSQTVKELLTATVNDLNPMNHLNPLKGVEGTHKNRTHKNHDRKQTSSHSSETKPKQLVSLKTYRKLRRKPSLRKFIAGMHRPMEENQPRDGKNACLIEGKTLQKCKVSSSPTLPNLDDGAENFSKNAAPDFTNMPGASPQSDSAKLRKRAKQRKEAAEKYEQFKRAMALDNKTQHIAKLAIISKCQTVVKPQTSLKGVAI